MWRRLAPCLTVPELVTFPAEGSAAVKVQRSGQGPGGADPAVCLQRCEKIVAGGLLGHRSDAVEAFGFVLTHGGNRLVKDADKE